jgi:cytochrome c-type biogenesis protein CcmH/NrfG
VALLLLLLLGVSACSRQARQADSVTSGASLTTRITADELRQLAADAYEASDWPRAEQRYGEVTRRDPADVEAWFRLGNIHARTGREASAVTAYREVVKRDPKHARAWHNLGIVQVRMAMATFAEMGAAVDSADPLARRGSELSSALESMLATDPEAAVATPLEPPQP